MKENVMLEFLNWMQGVMVRLTKEWPRELPAEDEALTEDFWLVACREEMRMRHTLSEKILELVDGRGAPQNLSPLEGWLLRRRMEWAAQLVDSAAQRSVEVEVTQNWLAEWALVRSWQTDGCQSMWQHGERGGMPHPEVPDWLNGLR